MNTEAIKEALAWAERNERAFDLAEYASNDPENTANRHYWQGQIDALKQVLELCEEVATNGIN